MNRFDIYQPCDMLRPYVKQFAVAENEEASTYKVLPDASLVIGIQYKGSLAQVAQGSESNLSPAGITGLLDSYRIFKNSSNIGTVLVYFTELGASAFFSHPMHELFGQSISLDNFLTSSTLEYLREQLAEANTDHQRIQTIERFLISQLQFAETDMLVNAAIAHIKQAKGNIRISELVQKLHISQSAFEKRFRKIVGATPKKYASIIRLNAVIHSFTDKQNLTELGLQTGYYDQAHFIKDFKQFSGDTPEKFFVKK